MRTKFSNSQNIENEMFSSFVRVEPSFLSKICVIQSKKKANLSAFLYVFWLLFVQEVFNLL